MVALALQLVGGRDVESSVTSPDEGLLRAISAKDQSAFNKLVQRHYAVVYRVVWRMLNGHADAEDVTQETFLRLWNNPSQIKDAAALRGWLVRVASNLVYDRSRRNRTTEIEKADEIPDDASNAAEQLDQSRASQRLNDAIARLPDRQRLALTLVQFEQFSNIAAASALEISVDACESLLARARRTLKQELSKDYRSMLQALSGER